MSMQELKAGDRVRVVTDNLEPHIHRGDKGTVKSGPSFVAGGGRCYTVALDQDPTQTGVVCTEDEIESDV
jgi:hypothetical protein